MAAGSANEFQQACPPSALTDPFWEGCAIGELRVQRCDACGNRFFTPLPACPHCLSEEWQWVQSPGMGSIYSFTLVTRPADLRIETPYVVIVVDLDDGWTMMSNLIDYEPHHLRCDQRVAVRFSPGAGRPALPTFAPLDGEPG